MYAVKREGDLLIAAPVSTILANELFLAWAGARRDRAQRLARAQRMEAEFAFPPIVGNVKDVTLARDYRAQLVGIVLEVFEERLPWLTPGSDHAGLVLEYVLSLVRAQTTASWWTARPTPELVIQSVLGPASEQEFERLAAPGYQPLETDLKVAHCPAGCAKFRVLKTVRQATCPSCGLAVAFGTCTGCSEVSAYEGAWAAWKCACGTTNINPLAPAPAPARAAAKPSLMHAFAKGFLGG